MRFIISIIVFLITFSSSGQNIEIAGMVDTISEFEILRENQEFRKQFNIKQKNTYHLSRLRLVSSMTGSAVYDSGGKIQTSFHRDIGKHKCTYVYDDAGRMIKEICNKIKFFPPDTITYKYNSKGQVIEYKTANLLFKYTYLDNGKTDTRVEGKKHLKYIYDNSDRLIFIIFNEKDTIQIFIYDENNRLIEKDQIGYKFWFLYDSSGNKIQSLFYYPDDELYEECYYRYNEKGRLIEKKCFNNLSKKLKNSCWYSMEYNSDGLDSKRISYRKNGRIKEVWIYKYEKYK